MNTTLACHFSRNTWTRERGYPSIKTNIQISIWYNEDRVERNYSIKFLLSRLPIPRKKKKREEEILQFPIWNLKLWRRSPGTSASKTSGASQPMKSLSAQPLFPIRGKWEATSWWYTVTKSHQSSLGLPKRYRIGRQLRANLSIYPSTKLWLGYQSFRWYIYIYSSFSQTLSSLSFSLYALLLVGRSRIPSWSRSTTLSSEISVRTTTRTATTLRNKQRAFLSRVTWEESSLSELGFAVGRDSHDHLVFTVAQRALKLKRIPFPECHREEGRRLPL